jgi:hypothetical protein
MPRTANEVALVHTEPGSASILDAAKTALVKLQLASKLGDRDPTMFTQNIALTHSEIDAVGEMTYLGLLTVQDMILTLEKADDPDLPPCEKN